MAERARRMGGAAVLAGAALAGLILVGATRSNRGSAGLCIEAEEGNLLFPFVQVRPGSIASGGAYITVPSGVPTGPAPPFREATWDIEISQHGTYYLWARILGPTPSSDAMFIGIDTLWVRIFPPKPNSWEWVRAGTYSLTQGLHVIQYGHQERDARLDALFLAYDPGTTPPNRCS
jgi:hypothetical protein